MNIWDAWKNYPLSKEETRTIVVAVIDTGIDYRHPDLRDNMWTNPNEIPDNGIDDDGNGYIDDIHGWDFYNNDATICHYVETANGYAVNPDDNDNHGTHIAGIIAAAANNSIGISGVASNVNIKIMSLKIHGGSTSSGSVANAIKAIHYAESMGADICNLSWGTLNYSQSLELTIRESSMLFVTAAGNNGINSNSTPMFPASLRLPNLISVAYIKDDGRLASDSNYGVSTVDLAAPGDNIYSTLVGSYGYSSGSSMAAPHITGLAAMLYAYQENIYPARVKEIIINTMTPLDSLGNHVINPGIPNAEAAVISLQELTPDTIAPFLILETSYVGENICVTVSAFDSGGSTTLTNTKTVTENGESRSEKREFTVKTELIQPIAYCILREMDGENREIRSLQLSREDFRTEDGYSYQVSPNAAYVLIEGCCTDGSIERSLYQGTEESKERQHDCHFAAAEKPNGIESLPLEILFP